MDYSVFPTIPVSLERSSLEQRWGFRLQGGIDYRLPLSVKKVCILYSYKKTNGCFSIKYYI
jgi:hypothetical protein